MSFRAFIAVDVRCGEELRKAIEELRGYGRPLKPVSPDIVHITLKFLGDTDERIVPEIEAVMRQAVADAPPFHINLIGTGVFPNARSPRVIWAGMQGAEPLVKLASSLDEGCGTLGFPREKRAFSPHLTLARVREGHKPDLLGFLQDHQGKEFGSFTVDRIKLKKSVLTPSGPIYSDVIEAAL